MRGGSHVTLRCFRGQGLRIGGVIVTIDGVAASGKSSVAFGVARALKVPYLSSGLLYRGVTVLALEEKLELTDAPALLGLLDKQTLRLAALPQGNRIYVLEAGRERDLTGVAHTGAVDAQVSAVARLPEVRKWVNARLRGVAAPFVAEGRDMGTAVFPGAQAKFFLTASPRIRAQRRVRERMDDLDAVETSLSERDQQDRQQSRPAPDALIIDTGPLDLAGVIAAVLAGIQARAGGLGEQIL